MYLSCLLLLFIIIIVTASTPQAKLTSVNYAESFLLDLKTSLAAKTTRWRQQVWPPLLLRTSRPILTSYNRNLSYNYSKCGRNYIIYKFHFVKLFNENSFDIMREIRP